MIYQFQPQCFPDLQGARYQSHHLCGIMYGRQVRHDRKIPMNKAQARHWHQQCSRSPAMTHSLGSWQSLWAFSPHLCCIRTLFGVVGAQGRLDVCVCICAYLLYHVFMYDGCHRFPILPMVAFQQSSETAETRREACLNALLNSLGLSTSGLVWLQFILLGHLILHLLPRSCLSCLFFSAYLEMTFFLITY